MQCLLYFHTSSLVSLCITMLHGQNSVSKKIINGRHACYYGLWEHDVLYFFLALFWNIRHRTVSTKIFLGEFTILRLYSKVCTVWVSLFSALEENVSK